MNTSFTAKCKSIMAATNFVEREERAFIYKLKSFYLIALMFLVPFVTEAQYLMPTPSSLANSQFVSGDQNGRSVSVSEDGNTVVKGNPKYSNGLGAVTVYFRDTMGNWSSGTMLSAGSGSIGSPNQGSAVAISADGKTILVGGSNDNNGVGAAWVYKKATNSNTFNQVGSKIVPQDYNGFPAFGSSVAISADGSKFVVGGPKDNLTVSVFESLNVSPKLPIINVSLGVNVPTPIWLLSKYIEFYYAWLELSCIGCDILGGWRNVRFIEVFLLETFMSEVNGRENEYLRNNVGAAWVFKKTNTGTYTQDGDKMQTNGGEGLLTLPNDVNMGVGFDQASQLYSANQSAAINGLNSVQSTINQWTSWVPFSIPSTNIPGHVNSREVRVAPIAGSPFYNELNDIYNSTNSRIFENAMQGSSVSISGDGEIVTVGAPGLIGNNGASLVYKYSSTNNCWVGEDIVVGSGSSGTPKLGSSSALSQDGQMLASGGPKDMNGQDTVGAVWIFKRAYNATAGRYAWSQSGSKIRGTGYTAGTSKRVNMGSAVSISSDKSKLLFGGEGDNNGTGAAWYFKSTGNSWAQLGNKIVPNTGVKAFGQSVSLGENGLTAAVGAPNNTANNAAFVFNSCQPPKPILSQAYDIICDYQFNNYQNHNHRLNSGQNWVWRKDSPTGPVVPLTNFSSYFSNEYNRYDWISTTTTLYVKAEGGCVDGLMDSIKTVVRPQPIITSTTPTYVCAPGGSVTLNATANSGVIVWSSQSISPNNNPAFPINPSLLGSGPSYTTNISQTKDFYATTNYNGCWSVSVAANARIEQIPSVSNYTTRLCRNGNPPTAFTLDATFSNTSLPTTYKWFEAPSGGSSLSSSYSYTTPQFQALSTQHKWDYYYEVSNACGVSLPRGKASALVSVYPDSASVHLTSGSSCPFFPTVLSAKEEFISTPEQFNDDPYNFRWYSSPTGGSYISDYGYPQTRTMGRFGVGDSLFVTDPLPVAQNLTYYVELVNQCGASQRKPVIAYSRNNAAPEIRLTPASVCSGQSATINAVVNEPNAAVSWWSHPVNGTVPLSYGNSEFTTPPLTASTYYYVSAQGNCGNSPYRLAIPVDVFNTPNVTIGQLDATCQGNPLPITLRASADYGRLNWFTSASGGTPISNSDSITILVPTTTTYYVQANSICPTNRIPVVATVNPEPQITQTVPGFRVNPGTINLSATSSFGTPVWTATDGSILGYGNNYTTWSLNETTTYFVAATADGCTSPRVPVVASILFNPEVYSTLNGKRCGAGTVTLNATARVGTIHWYDSNHNPVGTGNTFTTPSLSATTTYYVRSIYNTEESPEVAVKASIFNINNQEITFSAACNGSASSVSIVPSQLGVKYSLRTGNTTIDSKQGTLPGITLFTSPISSSTSFNILAEKIDSTTALNFDGQNDYVEVPNAAGINADTRLTLAAWIKRTSSGRNDYIISKGSYASNNGYSLQVLSANKLSLNIGMNEFFSNTTIPAAVWTHVAATYNGSEVKLYVNGILDATYSFNQEIRGNGGNLIIGSDQGNLGNPNYSFRGSIDDVCMYVNPSTLSEIQNIMNGQLLGNEYQLMAYFNFEHGSGISTLKNLSTNGFVNPDGVLTNMDINAAWTSGPPIAYCSQVINNTTLTPVVTPSVLFTTPSTRIGPGTLTLGATPSNGATINWYASPNATTVIATGNTFTTPILSNNAFYYASAINSNDCASPRVAVKATVNDLPESQQINCIYTDNDIVPFNQTGSPHVKSLLRIGQYLYTAAWGNDPIKVYNVSSGVATLVSTLALDPNNNNASLYDLDTANGYMYTIDRTSNAIWVINYSNPEALQVVGHSNSIFNIPSSLKVEGLYAYVTNGDNHSLDIIDVVNPLNCHTVGSIGLGEWANCIEKKENTIYVGVNGIGLKVVNVASVSYPQLLQTIPITGGINAVYRLGNFLYVGLAQSSFFKVYNISNAASPTFVRDVTMSGNVASFKADSKYLYCGIVTGDNLGKISVLNIADPSNPLPLASSAVSTTAPFDITPRLGHVYVANHRGPYGASIDDYAVPTAPIVTSTTPASRYGTGTVILGAASNSGTLQWFASPSGGSVLATGPSYTTPSISATTTYYVSVLDGSCVSFREPVTATVYDLPNCITSSADIGSSSRLNQNFVKTMARKGDYLYAALDNSIEVYNIAIGTPTLTSSFVGFSGQITDFQIVNNYLYAVGRYSEHLGVVDISNPAALQLLGSTGSIFNIPGGVVVDGNFAYVSNLDNGSIDVINVSNPASMSRVGQLNGIGAPGKCVKNGNYLYTTNAQYGFSIFDVSVPTAPTLVRHVNSKEGGDWTGASIVYRVGNYLYVGSDEGCVPRIKIYSLSNPTNPALVNNMATSGSTKAIYYDGTYLIVGFRQVGDGSLSVYNMANPESPVLLAVAGGAGGAEAIPSGLTTKPGYIYMARRDAEGRNIQAFPVGSAATITATTPGSRCGNGTVQLQATASTGTVKWYAQPTGGTSLFTGNNFTTPSLSSNTTFYAEANNACVSAKVPVLATVNTLPNILSTTAATRQDTGTVELGATTDIGLLKWFNTPSGGTALGVGTSFTTPVVNNTTTFYVESQGSICNSIRVPVVVTVITTPVIRTTTNGSNCGPGTVTLAATASTGVISWYAGPIGGTALGTGNSFNTPVISTTTYYYVETSENGVVSDRATVVANIGTMPSVANGGPDKQACGGVLTLAAVPPAVGFGYWTVNHGSAAVNNLSEDTVTVSSIAGTATLTWTVFSNFCPSSIDTVLVSSPKAPPVFYSTFAYGGGGSGGIMKFRVDSNILSTLFSATGAPIDMNSNNNGMCLAQNNKLYGASSSGGINNKGVIFEFDPVTNVYTKKYDLTISGQGGTLIECGSAGDLYGMTYVGGTADRGVLFKYNYISNTYSVVYNFTANDGQGPPASMVVTNGKIFGTTLNGKIGGPGNGTIFQFDPTTGVFTTLIDFPYESVVQANQLSVGPNGNLYFTSNYGRQFPNDRGAIFEYNYVTNTLYNRFNFNYLNGSSLGNYPKGKMCLSTNNKFYFYTSGAGADNRGTLLEYDPTTHVVTKKQDFYTQNGIGYSPQSSLVLGGDGFLYGSMYNGGTNGYGTIFKYNVSDNAFTVLKNLDGGVYNLTNSVMSEYAVSTANAGPDQVVCGRKATLAGNPPTSGTGTWTVVSGTGSFANNHNAQTLVTGLSDTTVLRWTITDGQCLYTSDDVKIVTKALPVITNTASSGCGPGAITLTATAAAGELKWYTDSIGGVLFGTGSSFITPILTSNQTYYVDLTANGCTSDRTPVAVTVAPTIITTTTAARCNAGTMNLQATASAGTINWYAAQTGGASLGTGNSFTTPSLNTTTTYYVDASNNSCTSARTAVAATVSASATIANAGPAQSNCSGVFTMAGNTPISGTGAWSVISGTATIAAAANPNTTVTIANGSATLRWTFSSTSCGTSTSDVVLTKTNASGPILIAGIANGGTGDMGSIVVFDKTSNTITRHTDSQGGANGIYSAGPLVKASNGKIYGIGGGGYYNGGTFFEYNPVNGTNTILKHFAPSSGPGQGSLFDYNGLLYYGKSAAAGIIETFNYTTNTFNQLIDIPTSTFINGLTGEMVKVGGKFYGCYASGGGSNLGGIFSYDPSSNTVVNLVSFNPSTGNSYSGLALAPNGKLYAASQNGGGTNNYGAILEYDIAANVLSVKQSFQSSQGTYPVGNLCLASNGLFYGVCETGGSNNRGSLFEYNPANNSLNIRWLFDANSNTPRTPLMQASDGALYGMTAYGGPSNKGTIYKYDINSASYSLLYTFTEDYLRNPGRSKFLENNVVYANAGPDQTLCSNSATLAAAAPIAGIGTWSVVAGSASFANVNSPTSAVTGIAGNNVLRWTVNYGSCNSVYDDVNIISTIGAASSTQTLCSGSQLTPITHPTTGATGIANSGVSGANGLPAGVSATWAADMITISGTPTAGGVYNYAIPLTGTCSNANAFGTITVTKAPPVFYSTFGVGAGGYGGIMKFRVDSNIQSTVFSSSGDVIDIQGISNGMILAQNNKLYGATRFGGSINNGVIFEFDPATNVFTKKHEFNNSLVEFAGSLIEYGSGDLYGMSWSGGTNSKGVFFKYNYITNTFAIVHNLTDNDGRGPGRSMVIANGKIFGTTLGGRTGGPGNGTIFQFDPATGVFTTLIDFPYASAASPNELSVGPNGNLYFTAYYGREFPNDRGGVFEYNYVTNTLYNRFQFTYLNQSSLGNNPTGKMCLATNNKYYFYCGGGGVNNRGTLLEYDPTTHAVTKKQDLSDQASIGYSAQSPLVRGGDGHLYGSMGSGGTNGKGTIYRYNVSDNAFTVLKNLNFDAYSLTYAVMSEYAVSTANAGPDQTVCGRRATLAGNVPTSGTGTWTVLSGTANFANSNQAQTVVTGLSDTTMLRWTIADGQCLNNFDDVKIVSKALPVITNTASSGCVPGAITLTATAATEGELKWYTDSIGGAIFGTGSSFITPNLTSNRTYYVDLTANGCTSARTPVAATVAPTITATTPAARCNAGTMNLQATASAGTINWYAAQTGGASLGTGNSFTTPSLTTTTTYYVDASNNSCTSARTAVAATVNPSATIANAGPAQSNCSGVFTLAGNTPIAGSGAWSVISGTATIATPSNANTTVTIPSGTATLRWTFSSTSCGTSTSDVLLTKTNASGPILIAGIANGGTNDAGSIVVFDKASNTITRHTDALGGANNIAYPGPLVKASNGKIYGISGGGGYYGFGTFFEYNPATGTNTILRHFGQSNGPRQGSLFDYNGLLYYSKGGSYGIIQTYNYNTNTFNQPLELTSLSSGVRGFTGEMVMVGGKFYGCYAEAGGANMGGIFSYDPSSNTVVNLLSFNSSTGNSFYGLALAPNGKLYAASQNGGGTNNYGAILEYDIAANVLSVKQSFQSSQGTYPAGNLCLASNGLFYGVCQNGGSNNRGSLFEYNPANNSLNIRWLFDANSNIPRTPLMQASDGALYGMTANGGPSNKGTIYKYDINSASFSLLYTLTEDYLRNPGDNKLLEHNVVYANAGPDQNICSNSTTLAAAAPIAGIGTWSVVAGSATFANVNSPTSTVTGIAGNNTLRWTVNYGSCTSVYDEVNIISTVGAASSVPTLCSGSQLTPITHPTAGATGIANSGVSGANGLPAGVSATWAANTITVSGTPTASGIFNYAIPITGGCSGANAVGTITVNALPSTTISANGPTAFSCGGSVTLTVPLSQGGTYTWSPGGETTRSITVNTSNTYSINVTDINGCSGSSSQVVTAVPILSASAGGTQILCSNSALVTMKHSTVGASGIENSGISGANGLPTGVSATLASDTIRISGTPTASGTFNYSIPLVGECGSANATGTIIVNALPSVEATPSQAVCSGSTVTLTASGATSYSWTGEITNGTAFTPNATNTYTVTGTDANGCQNTVSSTVTVNALPIVGATADQTVCSGTSVTLSGSGATSYSWTGGITDGTPFTANATTTYTLTGTDANGCQNTATSTVTVNPLPIVGATADQTVCSGSTVTLSGSGATSYSWTGGITDGTPFTANATTTYTLTGTDANGCQNTAASTVTVNALPIVGATDDQTVCNGTSVTLVGSGAVSYSWTGGITDGTTFPATATTTYTVTGTDANGCQNTATSTVSVNPLPIVGATADQTVCSGSTVTLSGTGAPAYSWTGGITDGTPFTATATTTYTVTGTDANGCQNTATSTLTVNPLPTVGATANQTVCSGTTVILSGSGATSYSWTGGITDGTPFSAIATTTYTVTGTDVNGCKNSATSTVTVNPLPIVGATASQTVCSGTSVTLAGSGAVSYSWTGGITDGTSFVATATTTYTVTGTDANGCQNTATSTVTVNPLPNVGATQDQTVCSGSTVTLSGTGAPAYSWTGGITDGISFTATATNTYTVTGTDANGCQNTATSTVTVNPLPNVVATASQTVCSGTTVTLSGSGAVSYSWTGDIMDGTPFTATATTTYTVTGTDANGCKNSVTSTVTVNPLPIVGATASQTVCSGTSVTLAGSGAVSYLWTGGITDGTSFAATATTTYTVTGTDANGCQNTATSTVTVNPLPIVGATASQTVCSGTTVTLSGTGAPAYSWTGGITDGVSFTATSTTTYTVTGTDANGCQNTATSTVTVNPLPNVVATASQTVCRGTTVTLFGSGAASYLWTGGITDGTSFTANETNTYTVTGTDANGCVSTATSTVTVNALPIVGATPDFVICQGTSVVLNGTGANTYAWTNDIMDGVPFNANETATYTVIGTDVNGCTGTATTNITTTPQPLWYRDLDGDGFGSIIHFGNACNQPLGYISNGGDCNDENFVINPSVLEICSNYVDENCNGNTNENCVATTKLAPAFCGATIATIATPISCVAVANATNYEYRFVHAASGFNQTYLRNSTLTSMTPFSVTGLTAGKIYTVYVRALVGGFWGEFAEPCTLNIPIQTTKLSAISCNATLVTVNDEVTCTASYGAANYEYNFVHQASGFNQNYIRGINSTSMRPSWIAGLLAGRTYEVKVRAYNGAAAMWSDWGDACNLTIALPVVPLTKLSTASCGATLSTVANSITCVSVSGATNYEYRFVHAASGFDQTYLRNSSSTSMVPSSIAGVVAGKVYTVTVRAFVNGFWGNFGDACTLNIPIQTTKLSATSCNATIPLISTSVSCLGVYGATNYEYRFVHQASGFDQNYVRGLSTTSMVPSAVPGLTAGKTYSVTVRAYNGAAAAWGNWGDACNLTIAVPIVPLTKLSTTSCGATLATLTTAVNCIAVSGATNYEYRFIHTATGFSQTYLRNSTSTSMTPSSVLGVTAGKTYMVSVRAFVAGFWGQFGNECPLTITIQKTKLSTTSCNSTIATIDNTITCNSISGGTNYQYQFIHAASGFNQMYVRGINSNSMRPSWVAGLTPNKTYTVYVRGYNGAAAAWGEWGDACTLTIGAVSRMEEDEPQVTNVEFQANAYPNPFLNSFTLSHNAIGHEVNIRVLDMLGKLVYETTTTASEINVGNGLAKGMYHITLTVGEERKDLKIIKQ